LAVLGALYLHFGAKRKPFFQFQFWRWWFAWSLFWFFVSGSGRDMLSDLSFDGFSLLLLVIASAYYFSFFAMLYVYAYVEKEIWRY
jgi:hypothetical protein